MAASAHRLHAVTLELLRHGPPHNQLLSPIAEYLALCGDLGAESVRIPFDQARYEKSRSVLSYGSDSSDALRQAELDEMGEVMREFLSAVRGLSAGFSQTTAEGSDMTHLRLVLTPHELALLPFECAFLPRGMSGASGQRLLLQMRNPVCLTREVRGVSSESFRWPIRPRILFAWASPPGAGDVPYEQHLLALRRALTPWLDPRHDRGWMHGIWSADPDEQKKRVQQRRRDEIKKLLTLLPNASVRDIQEACAATPFTHVHILAHGTSSDVPDYLSRVGVALHDHLDDDGLDVVDGTRLANALRYRRHQAEGGFTMPTMVTLASCDSGQVKSVVTHGGSLAHDLHEAGVPFVVASQFPLSKPGSVIMVDELYRRMLAAEDARVALYYTRRRLHLLFQEWHDWASLVAYASLPADYEEQVAAHQFEVAKRRINRLLDEADALIDQAPTSWSASAPTPNQMSAEDAYSRLIGLLDRLEEPSQELRERGADLVESIGLQASTEKRKAEVVFWASQLPQIFDSTQAAFEENCFALLQQSRRFYEEAMKCDLGRHWAAVQYLGLTHVLEAAGRLENDLSQEMWDELWTAAKVASEIDLAKYDAADAERNDTKALAWGHGSLAELYFLRALRPPALPGVVDLEAAELAKEHVRRLVSVVPPDAFEIYSTRRQFLRYEHWWGQLPTRPPAAGIVVPAGLAVEIVSLFPPIPSTYR